MAATNSTKTVADSLARDWLNAARSYLGGRRVLLIAAAVIVAGGLALNWSWLVAAGIAPLLIGVLPCVAMCALGLCMHKIGGRSCQSDKGNRTFREPWPEDVLPSHSVSEAAEQLELPWSGKEAEIRRPGTARTVMSERSNTDA